jgi:hypothetical protein
MNDFSINVNLALVLRGEVLEIREIAQALDRLLTDRPGVKLIHKQTSANKLWIKNGDEMNDNQSVD